MRLTNTIRDAFVRAAMQDVPEINYQEQIRKLVQDDAIAQLPKEVKAVAKKHPEYLNKTYVYNYGRTGICVIAPGSKNFKLSEDAQKKVNELDAKHREQNSVHTSLRQKLESVARSCTTRKALAEALPEFEKYLPTPEQALSRSVPALANVVTDFVKAGWPKDQKKAAEILAKKTIDKAKDSTPPAVIAL